MKNLVTKNMAKKTLNSKELKSVQGGELVANYGADYKTAKGQMK